ncbi:MULTISPECIES: S24/S26 family peptidase [Clostridium]|uniref:S24/S26 family peptidase n=1 Tax=Clostridium TaxID=1485 RepID=UPI000824A77B|nr:MULTISPECIES: S24/S26 family peptidase [Clostridium]PJI10251.1 hypothetical protein CUB90_21275 [Clostridium sp. CT7]
MKLFRTKGRSMYTLICEGDILMVDSLSSSTKIIFGDIVIYESHGILCAHRVFAHKKNCLIVAGDNCRKFEHIPYSNLHGIGRVLFKQDQIPVKLDRNIHRDILTIYIIGFILLNGITLKILRNIHNNKNIIYGFTNYVNSINQKIKNKLHRKYLKSCYKKNNQRLKRCNRV